MSTSTLETGLAKFALAALAPGVCSVYAVYAGNSLYAATTSAKVNILVTTSLDPASDSRKAVD